MNRPDHFELIPAQRSTERLQSLRSLVSDLRSAKTAEEMGERLRKLTITARVRRRPISRGER